MFESTFAVLHELLHSENGEEKYNAYMKTVYDKFANTNVDSLISRIKQFVTFAAVPTYAKKGFCNNQGYTHNVNSDGNFDSLSIHALIKNPNDDNDHYYIHADLSPMCLVITGGEHSRSMIKLMQIDNIFDFFAISDNEHSIQ